MTAVIEASGLGKRYGHKWALSECTLAIPAGKVVGLVGPNGAGKTTLLAALRRPPSSRALGRSPSSVGVPARRPTNSPASASSPRTTPTYARTVDPRSPAVRRVDEPELGRRSSPRTRIERLGLDPRQKAGKLSGGQRAQLALTFAVAKRPELLVLDEPVASLDPLARREFLQGLMEVVVEHGASVILSSHLVADFERVCDYLVVLVDSRVQVAGDIDELLASHHRLTGPRRDRDALPSDQQVIGESHTDKQSTLVVRTDEPILDPSWSVEQLDLEDLVLAYMTRAVEADRRPKLEVRS